MEAAAAGEAGGDAVTTEFTLRRSRRTQAAVAIALEEVRPRFTTCNAAVVEEASEGCIAPDAV